MSADSSPKPVNASVQALTLTELEAKPIATGAPALNLPPAASSAHPLHHVKASLTVCVGSVELTIGDLLAAKEHQILQLDRAIDQPVDILLEGQVIARGTLVAVDDRFGVRITEPPKPLHP